MPRSTRHRFQVAYEVRILAGIVAALLLCIGLVQLWPAPASDGDDRVYSTRPHEAIQIDDIRPTRQARKAPPPPRPPVPIIVPNDVPLEEVELEFTDALPVPDPGDDTEQQEGTAEEGPPARLASVEVGPKLVRIHQPDYPRAAKRKGVKAEVVVEVLINERGRVQEATIVERFVLGKDEDDPKEPVAQLGYGLEEAALSAAQQCLFRPARKNGTPVRSYTTVTLVFGV
ncbi:MAG: energy transducer TonB [Bacteroidetes bacterium]|nr:energy transducer TonB [Bacteroidota bacterium]